MRFMTIYKPGFEADGPPTEKEIAGMGALIGEMMQKGVLRARGRDAGLKTGSHERRRRCDS